MSDDIDAIARRLGMKRDEIIEVVLDADGVLVQTHDGVWTLIGNDGELRHQVPSPAPTAVDPDEANAAMLRGFRGEPEPAKPAPKRRSRT